MRDVGSTKTGDSSRVRASQQLPRLDDLRVLVEEGKVMPQVGKTYGLAETRDAVHYVADGHARGKVVIVVVPDK